MLYATCALAAIGLFFLSLAWMNATFAHLFTRPDQNILRHLANPFVGFFVGVLSVAICQSSSSLTTALVVCVSNGLIELPQALPVVMGANIGTTCTSTLIALTYLGQKRKLRRAIKASLLHNFFNLFTALLLLTLELGFQFFERLTHHWLGTTSMRTLTPPPPTHGLFSWIPNLQIASDSFLLSAMVVVFPFIVLWISIRWTSRMLYPFIPIQHTRQFKSPARAFGWGLGMTAVVQSSSLTSALLVPFMAERKLKPKRAAFFLLGANLGTTLTACIGAIMYLNPVAIALALFHLLFNLIGCALFGLLKPIQRLWLLCTKKAAKYMAIYPIIGLAYTLGIFFLIPYLLVLLFK